MTSFTEEDFDELVESGAVELDESKEITDGPPDDDEVVKMAKENQGKKKEETETPQTLDGDDIPEELRGKSVEEVVTFYKTLKDVSQNLAQQVKTGAKPPPPPPKEPVEPPSFTADDLVEEGAKGFNEKMSKFFEAKTAPLMETYATSMANMQRQQAMAASPVLQKYPETLNKIIQEHNLGPGQLMNPQTWTILESLVGREHFNELVQEQAAATKKPEPEVTAGVRATPEAVDGKVQLTSEEATIARALGVKPEVYAAMKPHTNQG